MGKLVFCLENQRSRISSVSFELLVWLISRVLFVWCYLKPRLGGLLFPSTYLLGLYHVLFTLVTQHLFLHLLLYYSLSHLPKWYMLCGHLLRFTGFFVYHNYKRETFPLVFVFFYSVVINNNNKNLFSFCRISTLHLVCERFQFLQASTLLLS